MDGMRLIVIGFAIKLAIVLPDLTFKGLIGPQNNSLINYTLGFTIYLSLNAVITARPSSHKSKFICHFRIAHYWEKLFFDKGSIEKLWY